MWRSIEGSDYQLSKEAYSFSNWNKSSLLWSFKYLVPNEKKYPKKVSARTMWCTKLPNLLDSDVTLSFSSKEEAEEVSNELLVTNCVRALEQKKNPC